MHKLLYESKYYTHILIHSIGIEGWLPSTRLQAFEDFLPSQKIQRTETCTFVNDTTDTTTTCSYQSTNPTSSTNIQPKTSSPPKRKILAITPEEQMKSLEKELKNDENFPTEIPIKETIGKCGLMFPRTFATQHPAAPLLQDYADNGCPVDCGPDWSLQKILDLMQRGPHTSAKAKRAITQLREETKGKIANNYARIVKWGDIKSNIPKKLKISPVAMIPHKSKSYRCILDLSFSLFKKGQKYKSVNETTNRLGKKEAMVQLGSSLQRLVAHLADNHHLDRPFKFTKLDIKDGFWRVRVNNIDAWNFCYVLPSLRPLTSIDETELVVPNSLQMGWCESPPLFCSCSETARDVIDSIYGEHDTLPPHRLEEAMLKNLISENMINIPAPPMDTITVTEVFVDDFIGMTNNLELEHMQHISRSMLHGIHSIFPPPEITNHSGGDSISEKKIKKGEGTWESQKEILGWIFDGNEFSIQLPPGSCGKCT